VSGGLKNTIDQSLFESWVPGIERGVVAIPNAQCNNLSGSWAGIPAWDCLY